MFLKLAIAHILADEKPNFAISDEILDGRPLYLDAQATTPLVRFQM